MWQGPYVIRKPVNNVANRNEWLSMVKDYDDDVTQVRAENAWTKLMTHETNMCVMVFPVDSLTPVGFMTLQTQDFVFGLNDFLYVSDLYVKPEYRRKGIARQLLQFAFDKGIAEGYERVYWVTEPSNPARKLYDQIGISEYIRYHKDLE